MLRRGIVEQSLTIGFSPIETPEEAEANIAVDGIAPPPVNEPVPDEPEDEFESRPKRNGNPSRESVE